MAAGVPDRIHACLFDLDGVLTETAVVHARAWKQVFDGFLRRHASATGSTFTPFDPVADYDRYVDGRSRADGTRTFLHARGITLAEGTPDDPPDSDTIYGLSNAKNEILLRLLAADGVKAYPGSVQYLDSVQAAGLRTAVVSASENCHAALAAAGLEGRFDTVVDGTVAKRDKLAGKPAPDSYLAAAAALAIPPSAAAVYEDAIAGVRAGRAGQFGWVVGVDRVGQTAELRASGADIVVTDLAELLTADHSND